MKYKIIKLEFQTEVHFGEKALDTGDKIIYADSLFSALCHEALSQKENVFKKLICAVKENRIIISDAMPYIGKEFYVPKPKKKILYDLPIQKDSTANNKILKKLAYIPVSQFDDYLNKKLDIEKTADDFKNIGDFHIRQKASIARDYTDSSPYAIKVFAFNKGSGLYVCIGYDSEQEYTLISDLFDQLSYTGIGGKVSSGLGKFTAHISNVPESLNKRLTENENTEENNTMYKNINNNSDVTDTVKYESRTEDKTTENLYTGTKNKDKMYMSLSLCLPKDEELDMALEDAVFLIKRRGGFISFDSCAGTAKKKKELYLFEAGSVFKNRFAGDIYDVSPETVPHEVYRYAKPMFMEV